MRKNVNLPLPWADFVHLKIEKFFNFDLICAKKNLKLAHLLKIDSYFFYGDMDFAGFLIQCKLLLTIPFFKIFF